MDSSESEDEEVESSLNIVKEERRHKKLLSQIKKLDEVEKYLLLYNHL